MASLSHFLDILEKELNAHIQKAVPEKTKIAKTYIKTFEGKKNMKLKYQFDSFAQQ